MSEQAKPNTSNTYNATIIGSINQKGGTTTVTQNNNSFPGELERLFKQLDTELDNLPVSSEEEKSNKEDAKEASTKLKDEVTKVLAGKEKKITFSGLYKAFKKVGLPTFQVAMKILHFPEIADAAAEVAKKLEN